MKVEIYRNNLEYIGRKEIELVNEKYSNVYIYHENDRECLVVNTKGMYLLLGMIKGELKEELLQQVQSLS